MRLLAMEILSENVFEYEIAKEDYQIIKNYLTEIAKRSNGASRNQKHVIIDCLNYINRNLETINTIDVKRYLQEIIDKQGYI